jgi:hypothetical protein
MAAVLRIASFLSRRLQPAFAALLVLSAAQLLGAALFEPGGAGAAARGLLPPHTAPDRS